MLLEQVERRTLSDRQTLAAFGISYSDLPDVGSAQENLMAMLNAEPEQYDPDRMDLLIALGLR